MTKKREKIQVRARGVKWKRQRKRLEDIHKHMGNQCGGDTRSIKRLTDIKAERERHRERETQRERGRGWTHTERHCNEWVFGHFHVRACHGEALPPWPTFCQLATHIHA